MKKTSRIWAVIGLTILILGLGVFTWAQLYLAPMIKDLIEKKGSEALGQPIKVESVHLGFLPLSVLVHEVDFNLPDGKSHLHLAALDIHLHLDLIQALSGSHIPISSLNFRLIKPAVQLDMDALALYRTKNPPAAKASSPVGTASDTLGGLPSPFDVGLKIEDGSIEIKKAALNLKLPISLHSHLTLQNSNVKVADTELNLAGCITQVLGQYDLIQQTGTLAAGSEIADLASIPTPEFLPTGKWSGPLSIKLQADNLNGKKWTANGHIQTPGIQGNLKFKNPDMQANGPLQLILNLAFDYDESLKVQTLNASGEFKDLNLTYKNLFAKAAGVPLNFHIQAQGDQSSLHIDQFEFHLSQLAVTGGGIASSKGSSNLHFEIARTSLAGLEKIFLPIAKDPVSGYLELKASLQGSLQNPEQMQIELQPLLLEQVRAKLDYQSDDKKKTLRGPLFIDAKLSLKAQGKDLRDANVQSHIVLTDLLIDVQDLIKKASGFPLVLDILALKKQNQIEFHSSRMLVGKSTVQLDGHLQDPQKPRLDLNLSTKSLQLADVSAALPMLDKYQLAGLLNAQIGLSGVYDFKQGLTESPLHLKANIALQMPKFVYKTNKTAAGSPAKNSSGASGSGKTQPPPESILPKWPIVRTADITSSVRISHLYYDDLAVEGLAWDGRFLQGTLQGGFSLQKVFDGSLNITDIKTNLALGQPDTNMQIAFNGLNTNDALTYLSKDWKDLLKGAASGKLKVFLPHPSRADFMARTRSDGHVEIKNAFLSTVQIDQALNQAVGKIPGVGNKQVANSKGVTGDMQMDFNFANSILSLSKFLFLSPDKDEIQAQGKVGIDKSIDMQGTAYLATAPVGGDVRAANSDATGRFVIPFLLKGSLADPQASFAQSTIEQILKKTAMYELNQQVNKYKDPKTLQDKLDDIKKNGLNGLFGK